MLPTRLRLDGNQAFRHSFLRNAIDAGNVVYELGGGSRPYLSTEKKSRMNIRVVGLDIDADELEAAPVGTYDRTIAADLCTYSGEGDADVVICQATLEHVQDSTGAIRAIATTLKPGGRAFIFAPCRNALFARLNLFLPQELKRQVLFKLLPHKDEEHEGFRAFYDRCTPSEISEIAKSNGLRVRTKKVFWISSYFFSFVPAYLFWRFFQGVSFLLKGEDAAESFVLVLEKAQLDQVRQLDDAKQKLIS